VLITANSKEELAALVSQVAVLSKLAIDLSDASMSTVGFFFFGFPPYLTHLVVDKALSKLALEVTRHCIDIHGEHRLL
jgi:hypothetical protein